MEDRKNAFKGRTLALCIILLGWVLCGYLVFRYTQIQNHSNFPDFCKTIFGSSCDDALSSPVAWHFGYPLAGLGLAYFGLLALLFSFRKPAIDKIVLLLSAFGTGVSVILISVIITREVSCPLCLTIHFINFVAFIALFLGLRSSISYSKQKWPAVRSSLVSWSILLLVVVILGGFSEVGIMKMSRTITLNEIAKNYQNEAVYSFPISDSSLFLGSAEAPVQLTVFSSFQCPACEVFALSLENIHKKFGKNVGITFKNFPLSSACNPKMSYNMQPRSCEAAFAAIAADRQNRFWEYHDQLFQSNLAADENTLTSIARNIGLDMEKWEHDRLSDEVKARLSEDVKKAYEIGINATPSVFINGRKATNIQEPILNFLIQHELDKISK